MAEALESALEGSEIGLTIPEDRQLTKETRKFCQISRESLPTLCRSLVLPAPHGAATPGLSPQVLLLMGGQPSKQLDQLTLTPQKPLRKWAAC